MSHSFRQKTLAAIRAALASTCIALPGAFASAADDLSRVTHFKIDAQPLDRALIEFSEQSGVQLMVASELVQGLDSPGVVGDYAATEALARILGTNELQFQISVNYTIAVVRPAPEARGLTLPGESGGVAELPGNRGLPGEGAGTRTGAPATLFDDYRNILDEVIVTGLRGKPRSVTESPSPIDVISAAALDQGGRAGVLQSIQYLVPSFHLPTRAGGSTSTVIATGGLRGLNPDQTLVLVNGKRRHTTSLINAVALVYNGSVPVDLDHIPITAIDRIEVLRDGAAAQYGSDAIAGVVNVILKDDRAGGALKMIAGQNFDRDDGEQREVLAHKAFPLGEEGFLDISAAWRDQSASNRAVPIDDTYPLYYPLTDGSPDPRESSADRLVTKNFGAFPVTSNSLAVNLQVPMSEQLELYGFSTYSRRSSILNWAYREPNNLNNIDSIYPDGFRPRLEIDETDYEVVGGIRGRNAGWDWDVASVYGANHAERYASGTINASLGPASPTEFYVGKLASRDWVSTLDLTRAYSTGAGDVQVSWGAQHHREMFRIEPGDPQSYAAGDWTFPEGHPRAGEQPAPGAQANHGITPDDASDARRDSMAIYGELGWTPDTRTFLGFAARYERYDDAAVDALVGKLSARYSVTDRLALRFTASTGFRAPPLAQQQYASTTSQFRDLDGDEINDLLLIKQLPPESPAAVALGSVPLVPEESLNLSVGVTLQTPGRISVTADAYRIDLDDRISITSTLDGPEVSAILAANGLSPELSGQYYTNAIDTTTNGLDLVATWAREFGAAGSLALNLGVNVNHTSIDRIAPNPLELAGLGSDLALFDRIRQGNLTYGIPGHKAIISMNWLLRRFDTNLKLSRFGDYRTVSNNPESEVRVAADTIVDLDVTYSVEDRWFLTVGANNLFNTYPTVVREPSERRGSGQYDPRGGFGFTGGSYFARLDLLF